MALFLSKCYKHVDASMVWCSCNSKLIKNGKTSYGKQRFMCKNCNTSSLEFYTYKAYYIDINDHIIALLKEGVGILGIAHLLKISASTVLARIKNIARSIKQPPIKLRQSYQLDEMRTFCKSKKNLIWIVYALNSKTKEVVSFNVGKRTNKTLKRIIKSRTLSGATAIHTDKLKNYQYLINSKIHFTRSRGTNHIEKKNLTLRTHLKRLNRRTLAFSKSIQVLEAVLKIYFRGKPLL